MKDSTKLFINWLFCVLAGVFWCVFGLIQDDFRLHIISAIWFVGAFVINSIAIAKRT